jgi:hypothetical protein
MQIKISMGIAITFCFILIAYSQAWGSSGWTSYGSVNELNPTTFKRFLVRINVASNPSSCKNKQIFYHYYSGAGSEYMFYTLLEAVTSGKNVRVYVTGVCDLDGYSEISKVSIVQ